MQNPFAEIVESSLTKIVAQCWDIETVPLFGELIAIRSSSTIIYGLVYHIQTGPVDNFRKPAPFKKTIDQLKKEQPHIFEFLMTTFICIPIAYTDKNILIHAFPSEPPHIHEFIYPVSDKEIMAVVDKKHFFMSIFSMQQQLNNIDELLVACIRLIHKKTKLPSSFYIDLLETYALLVGNEYRRIKLFAMRIEKISNSIII